VLVASSPVSAEEADRLFCGLQGFRKLGIAVSGGADSLALMCLLAEWRQGNPAAPDLVVLTVDHGLRPESAAEAEMVAGLARDRGLECRILKWTDPKPPANRQAEARDARFALMACALCEERGDGLVLAHHLEDQAETFLLRLGRGSGVYGLAAMASVSERAGIAILRPFLDVSRERLAATLRVRDLDWCSDPSNDDPAYARVRMRRLLPQLATEGLTPRRLSQTAARLGRAAAALDVWVHEVLARNAEVHPAGPVRMSLPVLQALPDEVLLRLVSHLLTRIGAQTYPPRIDRLERLIAELAQAEETQATLCGAVVRRTASALVFWREYGRVPPARLTVETPGAWVWDGRFAVSMTTLDRLRVLPLADARQLDDVAGLPEPPAGWPRVAFDTAPCLLRGTDAPYCPGFGGNTSPTGVEISLLPLFQAAKSTGNSLNSLHSRTT
jgi:tRNA(Ile)-lysidine synthase